MKNPDGEGEQGVGASAISLYRHNKAKIDRSTTARGATTGPTYAEGENPDDEGEQGIDESDEYGGDEASLEDRPEDEEAPRQESAREEPGQGETRRPAQTKADTGATKTAVVRQGQQQHRQKSFTQDPCNKIGASSPP